MAKNDMTVGQRSKAYNDATEELIQFFGDGLLEMGNWTPEKMVDMVGLIKIVVADGEQIVKTLHGLIDLKLDGKTEIVGENYIMTYKPMTQYRVTNASAEAVVRQLCGLLNGATLADGQKVNMTQEAIEKWIQALKGPIDMSQHRYEKIAKPIGQV